MPIRRRKTTEFIHCSACGGRGRIDGEMCLPCNGSGLVRK